MEGVKLGARKTALRPDKNRPCASVTARCLCVSLQRVGNWRRRPRFGAEQEASVARPLAEQFIEGNRVADDRR